MALVDNGKYLAVMPFFEDASDVRPDALGRVLGSSNSGHVATYSPSLCLFAASTRATHCTRV